MKWIALAWVVLAVTAGQACQNADGSQAAQRIPKDPDRFVAQDSIQILRDLQVLSHDSLEGRRTGTPGGRSARDYLGQRFVDAGLEAPPGGYIQLFQFPDRRDTTRIVQGGNVVGFVPGTGLEPGAIVVTAHFDHLGVRTPRSSGGSAAPVDSIFNGADDNASGTAGLLSLARYFVHHPGRHTMVFAALDAEEMGLRGSRTFVAHGWPSQMVLNVNLDMIARSDSILFAAGTYHYPQLKPILEGVVPHEPVVMRFGHDRPGVPGMQDWTRSSDHRPFHDQGIPFIYFGVEDHPDYHRASDEYEKVPPAFFLNAVRTILASLLALDQHLAP